MRRRAFAAASLALLLSGACSAGERPQSAEPRSAPTTLPTAGAPVATPAPSTSPTPQPYAALRVFVASETGAVWVLEGSSERAFAAVAKIAVGAMPHNIAVSPDGRWVVAANRMAGSVSVIDPGTRASGR